MYVSIYILFYVYTFCLHLKIALNLIFKQLSLFLCNYFLKFFIYNIFYRFSKLLCLSVCPPRPKQKRDWHVGN